MDDAEGPGNRRAENVVYTVGHSNQPIHELIEALRQNEICVIVDVRSKPYSRVAPQFNEPNLRDAAHRAAMKYVALGPELGGRPPEPEMYDAEGHVKYSLVARLPRFQEGVERLLEGIQRFRVAVLCSEENPMDCHRRLLIGRVLEEEGIAVLHIRSGGSIDSEERVAELERKAHPERHQLEAFRTEDDAWRSIRSVLPVTPPSSSSPRSRATV